jgi:hypothetical protein
MFAVDGETADAIRRVFDNDGELSAMIEFRRHYPGITDSVKACECVRIIAGWAPQPKPPAKGAVVRLRSRATSKRASGDGR